VSSTGQRKGLWRLVTLSCQQKRRNRFQIALFELLLFQRYKFCEKMIYFKVSYYPTEPNYTQTYCLCWYVFQSTLLKYSSHTPFIGRKTLYKVHIKYFSTVLGSLLSAANMFYIKRWHQISINLELGSLTINFCLANFEKNHFTKKHQNVLMITKYNLFTINKWIFKTQKKHPVSENTWL